MNETRSPRNRKLLHASAQHSSNAICHFIVTMATNKQTTPLQHGSEQKLSQPPFNRWNRKRHG